MWLSRLLLLGGRAVSSSSCGASDVVEGVAMFDGRLLVRLTVMEDGMLASRCWLNALAVRGEFRGVVLLGGGNFDRAECTRSSIFCMRLRRLFIWYSDSERGRESRPLGLLGLVRVGGFIAFASEVAALELDASDGPRACLVVTPLALCSCCLGVADGSGRSDGLLAGTGVFGSALTCAGASESGGEGGVGASDAESDFGGGVDAPGEEDVIPLASLAGLLERRFSTARGLGLRDLSVSMTDSALRSFSRRISLSTFRSPRSSRNRCASILSASRSCSPFFTSSSNKTPRSIAWFSFASRSSMLLVVFRACLS